MMSYDADPLDHALHRIEATLASFCNGRDLGSWFCLDVRRLFRCRSLQKAGPGLEKLA